MNWCIVDIANLIANLISLHAICFYIYAIRLKYMGGELFGSFLSKLFKVGAKIFGI